MSPENNANLEFDEEKNGLKIHLGSSGRNVIVRGESELNYNIDYLIPKIMDLKFRPVFDPVVKNASVIKKITENIDLIQIIVKGTFPVNDRSLTCYSFGERTDKDTFIVVNFTP
jgi:hypothetical protein